EGLHEQQRLVLTLELALPVVDGMDGRDDGAAPGPMLDDQGLAQPLGVVAASGRDHDHNGSVLHRRQFWVFIGRSNQTVATTSAMPPRSRPPITSDSQWTSR